MDHAIVARALHVLGVVLWIGGVGFVTSVLLPAVRRMKTADERYAGNLWQRFASAAYRCRGRKSWVGVLSEG